jgi:hypothetical protein
MRQATRQSILTQSKRAETRVARYLWGPKATRDWKDAHDLSGPDAEGQRWVGEVKSHAWATGPGAVWGLLLAALEQAEKHAHRAFACYIPPHCEPEKALVTYRVMGRPVVVPLRDFRQALGLEPEATQEASE